jgi:hypothetical protein
MRHVARYKVHALSRAAYVRLKAAKLTSLDTPGSGNCLEIELSNLFAVDNDRPRLPRSIIGFTSSAPRPKTARH